PRDKEQSMRWVTLLGTVFTFVLSVFLFIDFQAVNMQQSPEARKLTGRDDTLLSARVDQQLVGQKNAAAPNSRDLVVRIPWIARFNIEYYLGVDGLSMSLILLTTLLCVLAFITSWNIEKNVRGYCILFLILESGMLGTFLALDFFLFYIFWEVMLLPMYFLIGVWGGPRREYAAIKFFLFTLLGSVFILIAMLAFYF